MDANVRIAPVALEGVLMSSAIRSYCAKWFVFEGRATVGEMWWIALLQCVLILACAAIDSAAKGVGEALVGVCSVAVLVPNLAVAVRRLHDTDRSGWWILLSLVPVAGLILFVFYLQPGTRGPNRFGPDPRPQALVFSNGVS